uniref:Uncharacterized protein n=1 Tax=Cajanus cajan TaxID=3821 RepID=A0A151UGW2_CAJCA
MASLPIGDSKTEAIRRGRGIHVPNPTMKKIPAKSRMNPHKVPLPHSLISPLSEQCLILDDKPNKARVTKAQVQAKIQADSIPVAKVLKLSKLASDYRPFEAKRKLCDSYDLFFAEKIIVPLLPRRQE